MPSLGVYSRFIGIHIRPHHERRGGDVDIPRDACRGAIDEERISAKSSECGLSCFDGLCRRINRPTRPARRIY